MTISLWYLPLLGAGLAGFLISFYIHHKKASHGTMVCPLKANCDAVIYSDYAKFFGIPLELIGLAYYGLISVSYALFALFPALASPFLLFLLFVLTTTAFTFSIYLTFIQAVTLKQWCTWCLFSATLCTMIFVSAIAGSTVGFIPLLASYKGLILALHLFGMALGLGGATITDILFFRFLKDFEISEWEKGTLQILSQIIWFALGVIILSGVGLYLPAMATLAHSPKFLLKMVVVAVILANGVLLNLSIAPRLVALSFKESLHGENERWVHRRRKIAFALGAVSLVSWYSAFALGMMRTSPLPFILLLALYSFVLAIAILISQIVERAIARKEIQTH